MSWSRISSFAGVFVAAVASVATSAPEAAKADWELDDSTNGQTTLKPDLEYTTVHVKTKSLAVGSQLTVYAAIDPTPVQGSGPEDTPIVLFADVVEPYADGTNPLPTQMSALPRGSAEYGASDGYEYAARTDVPLGSNGRELVIRFAWTSPNKLDGVVERYDSYRATTIRTTRPVAPRKAVTIRWRAEIHAEGYNSPPPNASVNVELAQ